MDASRKEIYQGEEKLLISIDLGTTMSPLIHAARRLLQLTLSQVRWPTRICSQDQYPKSGRTFLAIVVPNL